MDKPLTLPLSLPLTLPLRNPHVDSGIASPLDISGLFFWHDATSSTADEDSGALVSLSDLSGNARPMNQAGFPSARGVLQDAIFGDRKGVLFASGDDYQIIDDDGMLVPSVGTYFCVARPASVHVGGMIGRGANTNGARGTTIRTLTNNGAVQFIVGNGTARVEAVFREVYGAGTVLRCVARWDTTKLDFNLNGSNDALTGEDPVSTHDLGDCASTTQTLRIGNSNEQFLGHIGVTGLFSRYLTDAETNQLAAYLEALYPD